MDLDDFDKPTQRPAGQSRFVPKGARKKPKVVPPKDDSIPAPTPVMVVKTEKMEVEEADVMEEEVKAVSTPNVISSKIDSEAMEEEEDDYVVAEYDVYFTPPNPDSQLYVMQYPLRPSWRPYELDQRCTEVRVRPNNKEVEVDLMIEVESDHYDRDSPIAEKMQRQTLSSSGRPPQAAAYAVGLLKGKKVYLNPIHAVVQLRPSREYLDFVDTKKKLAVKVEGSNNNTIYGPSRKQNNQTAEVVEPWIPLKYHSSTSDFAQTYLRKMVTEEGNPMQFSMNPYDYLNSLCPGEVINKAKSNVLFRRSMLSLPLEERLKKLFGEGPHIQRFNAIKHLAPDDPIEEVLKIVQQHATLVQGVWVAKSHDRYSELEAAEKNARDYALFLFAQNPVMKDSELDVLGSRKSVARIVVREIAVERKSCKDWKFKESTDVLFIKLYPDIVEHQRNAWQAYGTRLVERLTVTPRY